jgi:twinkle protein|tara:strand:+ start:6848 stop:8641 length:1794 start_codon:yes stop_codon:yes gene_type:complete
MEIRELKQRLADRSESIAKHLLPNGKKINGDWKVGSTDGEAGQSLSVKISEGIFTDFATGEGGDMIDLWGSVKGLTLTETLCEVRDYLGVEAPTFTKPRREKFKKPDRPKCQRPTGPVLQYLEGRGLYLKTIDAFKVAERGTDVIFPFIKNDELILAKFRPMDGKPMPTEAGCKPILFGWQAMSDDARELVITEGEIDAMTMHQYGFNALSVPFGAGSGGKHNWIAHEYTDLERFETIYLCMDTDGPGLEAADDLSERLGKHRCKIVELPYKDANECLQKEVTADQIQEAVNAAKQIDPEELCRASDFYDAVHESFYPSDTAQSGYSTPWKGLEELRFRPHELTLWTGSSGAGKSQLLSHATVDMMAQGAKCCLASLEMTPAASLKRMVKQAGGIDVPTDQYLKDTLDWMDDKLWLFNLVGKEKIDRLLDVFEYARRRYGVDTFIIDSFMRLGIGVDDYKAQDNAIFQLTDWVVQRPVHLHLVAHARKSENSGVPDTEAVKGTSEIGANAFNVLGVWRNRKLEDQLSQARLQNDEEEIRHLEAIPPVSINVAKNRNGDFEGKRGLHFDLRNYRYYSGQRDSRQYVPTVQPFDIDRVG